jgi:hypothetical protein
LGLENLQAFAPECILLGAGIKRLNIVGAIGIINVQHTICSRVINEIFMIATGMAQKTIIVQAVMPFILKWPVFITAIQ